MISLQLRKRQIRLPCEFPPKKLRNTSPKVLETRRLSLEHYIQSLIRQFQKQYQPLPQVLLDFLDLYSHLPNKVSEARVGPRPSIDSLDFTCSSSSNHRYPFSLNTGCFLENVFFCHKNNISLYFNLICTRSTFVLRNQTKSYLLLVLSLVDKISVICVTDPS